jgi:hypothetical protein
MTRQIGIIGDIVADMWADAVAHVVDVSVALAYRRAENSVGPCADGIVEPIAATQDPGNRVTDRTQARLLPP